jgi:hypothetical protein
VGEALKIMVPLFTGMLLPVWVPLIGVGIGEIKDRFFPTPSTPAEAVVDEVKAQSAARRVAYQLAA